MSNNISLIFHLYKNTKFLEKSIKSILSQTDKNFELIVVDDDSTQDVINIFTKNNFNNVDIKFISFSENFGHSFSFNHSVKYASNKYIYYFGSNVHLEPKFVETVNKIINENQNIDVFSFDLKGEKKKKEPLTLVNGIKDTISTNLVVQNKDKIISKNFLIKNKIRFTPFKHYSLLFFIDLLKANPKWVHINSNLAGTTGINSYSYNLYDTFSQIDEIIKHLSDENSFESKNFIEIEYFVILTLLYTFIIKIFKSKPNNGSAQSSVIKESYEKLNKYFPNWRNNPYLNPKNNFLNPNILFYLKNFKPYRYFVKLLLLRGKI